MTRLFTDGAETGDTGFWDLINGLSADNSVKFTGNYSYSTNNDSYSNKNIGANLSEYYLRVRLRTPGGQRAGDSNCVGIYKDGTEQFGFGITNTNVFSCTYGTGVITYPLATWILVEIWHKIDNSVGRLVAKVDGITVVDFTGDTQGTSSTVNIFSVRRHYGNIAYYDDLALNDTNGGVDNSWCGDGKIVALVPNGDSSVQWLGSDGDATNNYQLVDELPPSDSDYVRATGSAYTDIYTLSNQDFAGQTIQRIWVVSRGKSDTSGDYFLHGIQVSGTNYLVTGSLPTSFARIDAAGTGTWALNPYTNEAWSQEQLDNLLLVIKAPG